MVKVRVNIIETFLPNKLNSIKKLRKKALELCELAVDCSNRPSLSSKEITFFSSIFSLGEHQVNALTISNYNSYVIEFRKKTKDKDYSDPGRGI